MITGEREIIFPLTKVEGGYKLPGQNFYAYDEDQCYMDQLVRPKPDRRPVWDPKEQAFVMRDVIVDAVSDEEDVFLTLDEVNRGKKPMPVGD